MITSSTYLQAIQNCTTQMEANRVAEQILAPVPFERDSALEGNSFKSNIQVNWEVFYALVELEDKFNLEHNYSAYAAIILSKPKLSSHWATRANVKKCTDFEDYLLDMYMYIWKEVIPKWDKNINDNFFAMLQPEMLTVLNETAKPEVSNYLQHNHGKTLESYEAISEHLGHEFEMADDTTNVEERAVKDVTRLERDVYYELVQYSDLDDEEITEDEIKEQIKRALIVNQMFGGFSRELAERVLSAMTREKAAVMER